MLRFIIFCFIIWWGIRFVLRLLVKFYARRQYQATSRASVREKDISKSVRIIRERYLHDQDD